MEIIRRLIFLLLLLACPVIIYGQEVVKNKNLVERFFQRLAVSKADTFYATRYPFRFSIKPKLGISFGSFGFSWTENGIDKKILMRSEPIWKLGANFSYRNLTIGFQKDISRFFGESLGENSEYSASAYGTTLGGEFTYSVSSRYTFVDENDDKWEKQTDCFKSKRLQASAYYVFNNRRFSYPAAFTQSYHQKRSCGSFLVGLSLNYVFLEFDLDKLPEEIADHLNIAEYATEINYQSLNINGGYAYNWVISKRWTLHGSLLPSFSLFKKARMKFIGRGEKMGVDKVNVGCIFRTGVLWDSLRYFGGFTAVVTLNSMSRNPVEMIDFYTRTHLFYGFRF